MPPKLSTDLVRKKVESFGCSLLGDYNGSTQMIKVQCSCGNIFDTRFHNFIKDGYSHKCPECGWKFTGQKLKVDVMMISENLKSMGFIFNLNEYVDTRKPFRSEDKDGYLYYLNYSRIIDDNKNNYKPERFSQDNPFLKENIMLWLSKNNINFKILQILTNKNRVDVEMFCSACEESWRTSWTNILRGTRCPYCSKKKASKKDNLAIRFSFLAEEWDYEKNEGNPADYRARSNKKVGWKCLSCGFKWASRIADRTDGGMCPACGMSSGEKRIYYWLKSNNINFVIQYEFDDLLSDLGNPLKYDFAIFDKKNILQMLIEFDGEQHDRFVAIFHGNEDGYVRSKERDAAKTRYAKNRNIHLLRIPSKDKYCVYDILENRLAFLNG